MTKFPCMTLHSIQMFDLLFTRLWLVCICNTKVMNKWDVISIAQPELHSQRTLMIETSNVTSYKIIIFFASLLPSKYQMFDLRYWPSWDSDKFGSQKISIEGLPSYFFKLRYRQPYVSIFQNIFQIYSLYSLLWHESLKQFSANFQWIVSFVCL